MKKRYYNFSVLLNWVFIVATVLLLLRFDVINKVFSSNTPDNKNNKENISHSQMVSNMKDAFIKVKGSENLFELPSPRLKSKISLEETLNNRRSRREYKNTALNAAEVSQILWAAYGITKPLKNPEYVMGGLRTAPSAGARYPLEIYIVVANVEGLTKGLYKYIPKGHQLLKVLDGDIRQDLFAACWYQEMIAQAPATLVYSAVFTRTTIKYGSRGRERYVCMDLGHSAENVYLQAEALGLGTCAVGAFEDADVTKVLKLPKEEEILYLMPVGHYK